MNVRGVVDSFAVSGVAMLTLARFAIGSEGWPCAATATHEGIATTPTPRGRGLSRIRDAGRKGHLERVYLLYRDCSVAGVILGGGLECFGAGVILK
ncbi:hypothetical protein BX600DRAFT_64041 [Xylariales sp. PMI_506]|nr:hypothetical protein BX600DRAFT_64041 [Xylariales sp. PMI_506]